MCKHYKRKESFNRRIGALFMNISVANICWKCGTSVADHLLPLARTAECGSCRAELCVCKMCIFYDVNIAKSCRETIADEVYNKELANFCDYFSVKENAYQPPDTADAAQAKSELEQLFGIAGSDTTQANKDSTQSSKSDRDALDDLFK